MSVSYDAVRIASGAALSDAVDLAGGVFDGIVILSAWTAAAVTFQVSVDGTNFYNLVKSAGVGVPTEVVIGAVATPPVADTFIVIIDSDLPFEKGAYRYLKVRSGTSATPVNQGANRDIIVAFKF